MKISALKEICFLLCVLLPFLSAEVRAAKEVQSRALLGTVVSLSVCHADEDKDRLIKATDASWARLEQINVRMNPYDERSDIVLMNKSQGRPVKVAEDVYRLIALSKDHQKMTGGAFDVTVAPIMDLWKKAVKDQRYPSQDEVLRVKALVDVSKVELLPDQQVRLPKGMKIDLSGSAQGFAADEVAGILKSFGFRNFLIDTGGELYAAGKNCEGQPWHLGVSDPRESGQLYDMVVVSDMAVSTSGDYEKYYEIKGDRWSHIVNPLTGYPVHNIASSTVIAPTTTAADVLDTALCVLGPQAGLDLIASLGAEYAAVILERGQDGEIKSYASPGYEKFRVKDR